MFYTRLFFVGYMRNHIIILALLQLGSGMVTFIGKYHDGFFLLQLQILFGLCSGFVEGLAIVGIGGLGLYHQVVFIVYRILYIVGYFNNTFCNQYAAAVGVGSADLFVGCSV